ncbi:MAG: TetR/AcrR family transcriptional regulator [Eubacterium sp.]|nr:TetR/AcrR family transcriptional regulator [Eubacterium sp.]
MKQTPRKVSPMSNEARNSYVMQHITDALLELLHHKPIQRITISELCDLADVGRVSFYRNYESKEDILKTYVTQIFQEWVEEYEQNNGMPLNELVRSIFTHFENHIGFYRMLNDQKLIYLLKDVIVGLFGAKADSSKNEAYAKTFFVYSLYGWIEVWFQRGMQESAEELAELFKTQGL